MRGSSFRFPFRLVLLTSIFLLMLTGLATWALIDIPFGPVFNTVFHLAYGSLVLTLLLPGLRWLSARGWWRKLCGGVLSLLALAFTLLLVTLHVDYTVLPFFDINRGLAKQAWHEDLAYLAAELPSRHPDLYSLVEEARFQHEVAELDQRIDTLDEVAIRAGFARIVALPDDGHTYPNIFSLNLDWHVYPLAIHFFGEQLTIVDTGRERKDLIGSHITRIDDTPLAAVLDTMEAYLAIESAPMRQERLCNILGVAEWLYAAGVTSRADRATFTLVGRNGRQSAVTLKAIHYLPGVYWMMGNKVDDEITSIAIKGERRTNYHFEMLPESETLYFQFNLVSEEGQNETLADFIERLGFYVAHHDFERFVIDVRNNDGGNGGLLPPLVEFLAGSEKINREGRLFILISRRTYSAAVMFTAMMQNNAKAITVGEATSQGPLFYSVPQILKLPNSGLEYLVSSRLTKASLSCDRRNCIKPDLPIDFTWEDHISGRDPCLEAVIAYEHQPRLLAPVDEVTAARVAGRYRFNLLQTLTIHETAEGLHLEVSDFLTGSTQNVLTGLYQISPTSLRTDIPGVEISFAPGSEAVPALTLVCREEFVAVPRMPVDQRLPMELLRQGHTDAAIHGLRDDKDLYRTQVPGLKAILNREGYSQLRDGRFTEAIALFRLNVELYPESSNVYDSLGEAYLANGERELSLANYRRSLELDSGNENARRILADLAE